MAALRGRKVLVAMALAMLSISIGLVALFIQLTSPSLTSPDHRYEVSLSTAGTPVTGSDFSISVTVRDRARSSANGTFTFLSIVDAYGFEVFSPRIADNPWGVPGTWNLTGDDLSSGQTFVLETTPRWAAEQRLEAFVWQSRGNLSTVRLLGRPPRIDMTSVDLRGFAFLPLTTYWPVQLGVSATGDLRVGGNASLTTRVEGVAGGPHAPSLLYLSLEIKPTYYQIRAANDDDDPWRLPNVWNLTGIDFSQGREFILAVSPSLCGSRIPVEARVWAPRGNWSEVQYDADGMLANPESISLWGSRTVDFPVSC